MSDKPKLHSSKVLEEFWFYMNDKDTERFNNEFEETLVTTHHKKLKDIEIKVRDEFFYELLDRYFREAENAGRTPKNPRKR